MKMFYHKISDKERKTANGSNFY